MSSDNTDITELERLERLQNTVKASDHEGKANISLEHTKEHGVYVSAAGDLDKDAVVCSSNAIGPMPECDFMRYVCDNCYTAPPSNTDWFQQLDSLDIMCNGCSSLYYCSAACEVAGRAHTHTQSECSAFDYIRTTQRTAVRQHRRRCRQLLRLMLMKHSESKSTIDTYQELSLLCNNYSSHSASQIEVLEGLTRMALRALRFVGVQTEEADFIWGVRILMTLNCNQFGMQRVSDGVVYATALFLIPSLFNHHCSPNVRYTSEGTKLVLRTNHKVHSGEELQHNYLQRSALKTCDDRQKALRSSYFFTCACTICADNLPSPSTSGTALNANVNRLCDSDGSSDEAGCYWNSDLDSD
eukprot:CFRG6425T1